MKITSCSLLAAILFNGAVTTGIAQLPTGPDLIVSQSVFAELQKTDGFYRLQFEVRNMGNAEAGVANVALALYQSADKRWDAQDLQINGRLPVSAAPLPPNRSAEGVLSGRLQFQGEVNYAKMRKKTPYLLLVADPFFTLDEMDETNNVRVIALPPM